MKPLASFACFFCSRISGAVLVFLLIPALSFGGEAGRETQNEVNAIFLGLAFLAFVNCAVIGALAYLWRRHSKYKKQKVILDI